MEINLQYPKAKPKVNLTGPNWTLCPNELIPIGLKKIIKFDWKGLAKIIWDNLEVKKAVWNLEDIWLVF